MVIGCPEWNSLRRSRAGPRAGDARHRQVAVECLFDAADVDRPHAAEVGAVPGREGVAIAVEQLDAPGARRTPRPARPARSSVQDRIAWATVLDRCGVVVDGVAGLDPHDEVDPGENGLGQPRLVLDADATEGVEQDALDRDPVVGVEPVVGQEHQAREVPAEPLTADEHAQPLALLEPQDAHGRVIQLVLVDLEQFVAQFSRIVSRSLAS